MKTTLSPAWLGATQYEGIWLFFPSIYFHFLPSAPISGIPNDGLWDTRLVVSRGGVDANLSYAGGPVFGNEARNARRPLVPMGVNTCQFEGSVDELGGWCSYWPTDSGESFVHSSFDTSYNALTRGYVVSPDGQWLYLYGSGQSMTHGGAHVGTVFNESGVALLALRRDGENFPSRFTATLNVWSSLFTLFETGL